MVERKTIDLSALFDAHEEQACAMLAVVGGLVLTRGGLVEETLFQQIVVGYPGDGLDAQVGSDGWQERGQVPFVRCRESRTRLRHVVTQDRLAAGGGRGVVV